MKSLLLLLMFPFVASAAELRAFAFGNQIKSDEMNSMLENQSLKQLHNLPGFGAEVDGEAFARIHLGLRFAVEHLHVGDGLGTALVPDGGFSELHAETYQVIMRWALIEGPLRFDLWGAAGGIKALLKTKNTSGEFEQGLRPDDLRFMQSAGATIAVGGQNVKVFIEGGFQWAPVARLKHSAGTPEEINMIDLTGPFAGVGIMFHAASK